MVTKRLQYRYDAVGNKVGMTDADGGLFTYTYDLMRRLTGVINPVGERTTYTYDLNGRRTSAQLANGTRTSYSYDQGSRVQQIHTLKSNNSTVAKFDYAYDNNGRRTSVLEADGSRVTWTYDGTSQVTSEWRTGTSPFRHTFVYDTRGNRTLKVEDGARTTLVYDAANQLSSSQDAGGTTNYTYDANGNQHVTVAPGGSRTTQIWDYENRLVKTLQPGAGVFTMAYDADGLRVRKETPSEAKLFVWDDQNYLAETDDSGVTEVAYTTEPSTYGSTISHRTGGATTTYHFDALAAARVLTNASETVLESYNYTAFGTILGAPTLLTPFLWGGLVGYYWDAELTTQYIRARHYQPSIARWISLDPIGFAGGDANLFRYVGNSPISGANTALFLFSSLILNDIYATLSNGVASMFLGVMNASQRKPRNQLHASMFYSTDPSGLMSDDTAKRIVAQGVYATGYADPAGGIIPGNVDPVGDNCKNEILSIMYGQLLIDMLRSVGNSLQTDIIKKVLKLDQFDSDGGGSNKIKRVRKLIKDITIGIIQKGLEGGGKAIGNDLIDELHNRTKIPKDIIRSQLGDIDSLLKGDCRSVTDTYSSMCKDPSFTIKCEYLVCAEISRGFWAKDENFKNWRVVGMCDFKCKHKDGSACICPDKQHYIDRSGA